MTFFLGLTFFLAGAFSGTLLTLLRLDVFLSRYLVCTLDCGVCHAD